MNIFGEIIVHKLTDGLFESYDKGIDKESKKKIFRGVDKVYALSFTLQSCEEIKKFKSESKG
jgi:hypothetical protein